MYAANGVKNQHPIAVKHDIGIYAESNGHGCFHVNREKLKIVKQLYKEVE